jgi:hypothetical protein
MLVSDLQSGCPFCRARQSPARRCGRNGPLITLLWPAGAKTGHLDRRETGTLDAEVLASFSGGRW